MKPQTSPDTSILDILNCQEAATHESRSRTRYSPEPLAGWDLHPLDTRRLATAHANFGRLLAAR